MNSLQEVKDFINNIDAGEAIYKVDIRYNDLTLDMSHWDLREKLRDDDSYWLNRELGYAISRSYDKNLKKMVVNDRQEVIKRIIRTINGEILDVFYKTSPAEQPRRTKAYKSMNKVKSMHRDSEELAKDALPILNYYFKTKTDENESHNWQTHKNNTYALLDILRKKYDNSSS